MLFWNHAEMELRINSCTLGFYRAVQNFDYLEDILFIAWNHVLYANTKGRLYDIINNENERYICA